MDTALVVNLSIAALLVALVTAATSIATRRLPFDYTADQPRGVEHRLHDRLMVDKVSEVCISPGLPREVVAAGDEKR